MTVRISPEGTRGLPTHASHIAASAVPCVPRGKVSTRIRAVVTDLDGTLWRRPSNTILDSLGCKAAVESILAQETPVAVITEATATVVERALWRHIPPPLRKSLYLFTNGGACGTTFPDGQHPRVLFQNVVADQVRRRICATVQRAFSGVSAARYRVIRRSYKVKIEILVGDLDPTVLERELCRAGIAAEIVHEPGCKISVYPFGKEAAAKWFDETVLKRLDISQESVMVIGDQIQAYGGDRRLFEYYRLGKRVNVGRPVCGLRGGHLFQDHDAHEKATEKHLISLCRATESRGPALGEHRMGET